MISTFIVMMLCGLIWQTVCEETPIQDWRVYVGQLLFAGGLLGLSITALKFLLDQMK